VLSMRFAEFNPLFNEAVKRMLANLSPENAQEVWEGTYEKVKAVLDGETDLLEEFELFHSESGCKGSSEGNVS